MNQLDRIIEISGLPCEEDIEAINSPFAATMLESLPPTNHRTKLSDLFPHASKDALDLLSKCLQFNPQKRITCDEALKHPFVGEFHVPAEEISCAGVIRIPIDDNHKYSISDYRNQLYEDIVSKKKEQRRKRKSRRHKRSGSGDKSSKKSKDKGEKSEKSTSEKGEKSDRKERKHSSKDKDKDKEKKKSKKKTEE